MSKVRMLYPMEERPERRCREMEQEGRVMGQHRYNPTAIAARDGKLPGKPEKMSKAMSEREMRGMIWSAIAHKSPAAAAIAAALSRNRYS